MTDWMPRFQPHASLWAGRFAALGYEVTMVCPKIARQTFPVSRRQWIQSATAVPLVFAGCASGEREARTIKIGAMQPGTSWYVFGVTLAKLLSDKLPDKFVEVIPRGGGVGNPIVVSRGRATIAIAQAASSVWAFEGDAIAFRGQAHPRLRALLGGMNSVWMSAMLREDYIRRTGNDTLEKALLGNSPARIVLKPPGSSIPVLMDIMLSVLGSSREDLHARGGDVIQVGASQIPALLRDGYADLYLEGAIRGHPTMTEITSTVDVRFLEMPDAVLRAVQKPGILAGLMPKWFPGQDGPLRSVDLGTVLVCREDMPDDLAWLVTKLVCEQKNELAEAHRAWLDFRPEAAGTIENTGIPLHPAAERYLGEQGWL